MTRASKLGAGSMIAAAIALLGTIVLAATGTAGTGAVGSAAPIGRSLIAISKTLAAPQARTVAQASPATPPLPKPTSQPEATQTPRSTPGQKTTPPPRRGADHVVLTATALPPATAPGDPTLFPELEWEMEGDAVTVLQRRLAELGFLRADEVDGNFGESTWSAVLAFQKFEGMERTGWVDASTWLRLYHPTGHLPPPQPVNLPARVEVDLERQVVFAHNFDGIGSLSILNASSGGNYWYTDPESKREELAYTPAGDFSVYRRFDGLEKAPLGELYRPLYFTGGWALHGSTDVPAYPASHGCVRLSYPDIDWLYERAKDGMPVRVMETMSPAALLSERLQTEAEPYLAAAEGMSANLAAA